MKPILFSLTLVFTTLACFAQDYYGNNRKQWLQKAEQYKPKLIITEKKPLKVVAVSYTHLFFSSFSNIYEANLSGIPRTYAHKRVRKKRKRKIKTQTKHEQTNIITKYTES